MYSSVCCAVFINVKYPVCRVYKCTLCRAHYKLLPSLLTQKYLLREVVKKVKENINLQVTLGGGLDFEKQGGG